MSWTSFRRRGETLRDVIAVADLHRDGILPTDIDTRGAFADEIDLLGALHLRWHTRLAGRIDYELTRQPHDLDGAVIDAWHACADELPGARTILDHYRAHPSSSKMERMLEKAVGKEHLMLAVMAGRAGAGEHQELAKTVGARIELAARTSYVPDRPATRPERPTMLGRLRAAIAA